MLPPAPPAAHAAADSVAAMRWHRRVLLVAAASAADPRLAEQRRVLGGWHRGAADRDLTVVEVIGDRVTGANDSAAALRRHWHLPADRFTAILIGKDGGEKLRAAHPFQPDTLRDTIDAMPMRQSGQR